MTRTKVLLVAAATSMLLLTACGSDQPEASDPTSSSPTTAEPTTPATSGPDATTTPDAPAGQLLDYETDDANGVSITTAADTAKLTGAPADFKAFIASELAKAQSTTDDVCTEKPQIYVSRLDTGGWAAGGHFVPQCGGNATLWAKPGGTWQEVWSGQELTDCATLEKYEFPADVVGGTCLDGEDERPYTAGGVDVE